jgi:hypothetical protein
VAVGFGTVAKAIAAFAMRREEREEEVDVHVVQ